MNSFVDPQAISAYIICKTHTDAKYLLIRRCGRLLPGTWQMVTGGVHIGETAWETALREIQEETGIIPDSLYSADTVETFYMASNDKIAFVPVFVAFIHEPTTVQLSPDEHDAYEWLSFENAMKRLVWSEQRRTLTHVHENFVLNEPHSLLLVEAQSCP